MGYKGGFACQTPYFYMFYKYFQDYYDLFEYIVIFCVIALIILKSIINNIKDKILYDSLAKINDNVETIKNNKSNDL